ncbi:hypothetical protein M9H77_24171 [Catharanthus roseus]|uniref:Uncharacterized protein n=1 Tax=Catharanthus roseus TaxID=4058 RepID=A0ACC0AY38_CATRO|nr:hypothetical protein M9H77_24171 [Catharanthus roseus]
MMTSMLQEVDDMASVAIREPPSSPSQIAAIMKKVQTIIRRCMVSIGGTLGCTPSQHDIQATFPVQPSRSCPREHVPDRGARGVKRGAWRHPGQEAGAGRPPVPPAPQRQEHVDPFDSPHLDMPSYSLALQSPHPSAYGFAGFRAPPPPGKAGSLRPQQPISQASSSDEEQGQDALGRGHHVGKKTVRFTPSD